MTESVTTDVHIVYQFITLSSATTNTLTVYLKAGTRNFAMLRVGGGAYPTAPAIKVGLTGVGTVATIEGPVTSSSVTLAGNGWYRATMTFVAPALNTYAPQFGPHDNGSTITYTGNGTGSVYAWGAQLEAGAFPTSYIPTVASTVTRSADIATMTGTNFSSWYNASEGTFVSDFDALVSANTNSAQILSAWASVNNLNRIWMWSGAPGIIRNSVVSGGTGQSELTGATIVANTPVKAAATYRVNDYAFTTNGGAVATDTLGALPVGINLLGIGQRGDSQEFLNGHIRQIAYYNTRLPNTQLQTLTAPSLATTLSLSFTNQAYTVGV